MKKLLMAMLVCGMMASMCACGNKAEEAAAPAETEVATEEAVTEEAVTEEAPVEEAATEEVPVEETAEATEGTVVTGIITEAAMNTFSIQAEDGTYYLFAKDENAKVNCADGILLGEVVDVTYTGTQEAGDTVAVEINDSTVAAKADKDVIAFAISVMQSVQFMDQEGLSSMMTYPAYVCAGDVDETVADADAFKAIDSEKLFLLELSDAVVNYNLFNLEEVPGTGYIMGDGTPNIIFQVDESSDFGFGITAINGK